MTDIIDLIDEVTAPSCGSCGKPLRPDGPSLDFCGETCAAAWHHHRANVEAGGLSIYATGGLIPTSPEELTFLPTTPLPGFRMDLTGLTAGRTWDTPPPGAPATGVFIGGSRHGQTFGVPDPPRHTLELIEEINAGRALRGGDAARITYRLRGHNGAHWCYVDTRPAAPSRTVHVAGHEPITIDYHRRDFQCDLWWVTITGRTRDVLCELPGELLADNVATSTWFAECSQDSGWTVTDGSWDVTEQRPPWQQDPCYQPNAILPSSTRPDTWITHDGLTITTAERQGDFELLTLTVTITDNRLPHHQRIPRQLHGDPLAWAAWLDAATDTYRQERARILALGRAELVGGPAAGQRLSVSTPAPLRCMVPLSPSMGIDSYGTAHYLRSHVHLDGDRWVYVHDAPEGERSATTGAESAEVDNRTGQ